MILYTYMDPSTYHMNILDRFMTEQNPFPDHLINEDFFADADKFIREHWTEFKTIYLDILSYNLRRIRGKPLMPPIDPHCAQHLSEMHNVFHRVISKYSLNQVYHTHLNQVRYSWNCEANTDRPDVKRTMLHLMNLDDVTAIPIDNDGIVFKITTPVNCDTLIGAYVLDEDHHVIGYDVAEQTVHVNPPITIVLPRYPVFKAQYIPICKTLNSLSDELRAKVIMDMAKISLENNDYTWTMMLLPPYRLIDGEVFILASTLRQLGYGWHNTVQTQSGVE